MEGESATILCLKDQILESKKVVEECDFTINNKGCCFNIIKILSKKNE